MANVFAFVTYINVFVTHVFAKPAVKPIIKSTLSRNNAINVRVVLFLKMRQKYVER